MVSKPGTGAGHYLAFIAFSGTREVVSQSANSSLHPIPSLVYKHFKAIFKRAGLPNIRLYDLRHTAATLALTVGVSPKVVSEQLGHTSAAFTLDVYSHVLPHMQDDAAAKVEAALTGSF